MTLPDLSVELLNALMGIKSRSNLYFEKQRDEIHNIELEHWRSEIFGRENSTEAG